MSGGVNWKGCGIWWWCECGWCGDREFWWWRGALEGLIGVIGEMCEFGWGEGCMGDRLVGEATDREERLSESAVEGLSWREGSDICCDW